MIRGTCSPAFAGVLDAFAAVTANGEGGALAVYLDGEHVVDVWGGKASLDSGLPWERDTMCLVMSTSKGLTTTCALGHCDAGRLDLDAPIATVWPEFGRAGKSRVTLRHVLTHSAGLPAFDQPIAFDDCHDASVVADALAAQSPRWDPGTSHGYHAMTFGWLVGEVVRRATGQTIGETLADLRQALGLESYIGLPAELEARVAPLQELPSDRPIDPDPDPDAEAFLQALFDRRSLTFRVFTNPRGQLDFARYNSRRLHAAEWPSVNAITTARSLATLYGSLVSGKVLSAPMMAEALRPQVDGDDLVLRSRTTFGLGFALSIAHQERQLPTAIFGHEGAGGSVALADRHHGFGFAFVTNILAVSQGMDERGGSLLRAVYDSLRVVT